MTSVKPGTSRTLPTPLKQAPHGLVYHHGGGYQEVFLSSNKLVLMFSERTWQPPTDIYETTEEIIIKMEIAGIKSEEVNINLNNDKIDIKGIRTDRETGSKRVFRQMEINYGQFQRSILIHGPYDAQTIKATYKDGFLEIVIPKMKKSKPATKQVEISFEK